VQIGSYKIIQTLGAGGMGIVFRAQDPSGRPVAIKMIGSKAAIDATIFAGHAIEKPLALDEKRRMMLVREASIAMKLDHPNIVRVFDYGQHNGLLYIVMEFLQGRSLDKVVPIHASVPLRTKLSLIRQICEALEFAHRQGVLHRDVKPANAMVLQDAKLKVLDFGLAARLREPLPGEVAFVGTPGFMAPELVAGSGGFDARSDIWATGVTLYQFLTGRLPFIATSIGETLNNIARQKFPPLDESFPHKRELERILDRALAKNPRNRYASAGDFALDLRELEEKASEPQSLPPSSITVIDDEPESQSTMTLAAFGPGPEVSQAGETVAMISGEVRARRGGHSARLLAYNNFVSPIASRAFLCAAIPTLFMVGCESCRSPNADFLTWIRGTVVIQDSSPPLVLLRLPLLLCSLFVSLSLAVGFVLWLLAFREKFHEIPRCHTCTVRMKHLSRVDRFSYTETSRKHASSDCLAALKENLWNDAAKLLSMHGELYSPKTKVTVPVIRYCLDFYACRVCGDEAALLTSEDGKHKALKPRVEFEGAYKAKSRSAVVPSAPQRKSGSREAAKRAAALATESVNPGTVRVLLIGVTLLCAYYSPLIPQLARVFGNETKITITSDPPGQWIAVDGKRVQTPATFWWTFHSDHALGGLYDRQINGIPFRFRSVIGWDPTYYSSHREDRVVCDLSGIHSGQCGISIAQEADGADSPRITSYTVRFVRADSQSVAAGGKDGGQAADAAKPFGITAGRMPAESKTRSAAPGRAAPNQATWGNGRTNTPPAGQSTADSLLADGKSPARLPFAKFLFTSDPGGLSLTVDRSRIATPRSFQWLIGSIHTLNVPSGTKVWIQATYTIETSTQTFYADGIWITNPGENTIFVRAPPFHSNLVSLTYTAKFQKVAANRAP
jgi:serine/threonine protein kinase